MNDLFSHSFKKYQDVKHQVQMNDLEAGQSTGESADLNAFFTDVENVKQDMNDIDKLYKRLQDSNEEIKTVHNSKTVKELRSRMDGDVSLVLKRVKVIKGKLEALERSNAAHRRVPGCGPGSSSDRTRTSVVSGLGKKLQTTMDDFQGLRARMNDEYKETVARRYFTVTGEKANDDLIENMISSGESETFLQKAIQEQGRGQILDTISEIQERHDAVKVIEKNLLELHQIFLDMAALVEAQGQQLNDIESHVAHASSFVRRGTEQLQEARVYQKSSREMHVHCYLPHYNSSSFIDVSNLVSNFDAITLVTFLLVHYLLGCVLFVITILVRRIEHYQLCVNIMVDYPVMNSSGILMFFKD